MVNASLNWASIVGIVLAVGGALLYFMRSFKPALARDYDVFFAAIGLLCGGILFFQGWRLDPILQFGQFLLASTTVFFAYESVRLRGVSTEQARRSAYFDDEPMPARGPSGGLNGSWDSSYDRFDAPDPQPLRRRFQGVADDGYGDDEGSESDFYRPRRPSRAAIPEQAASRRRDRDQASNNWDERNEQDRRMARFGRRDESSESRSNFGDRRGPRQEQRRGSRPSASRPGTPDQESSNTRSSTVADSPSRGDSRPLASASTGIPQGSPMRPTPEDAAFSPSSRGQRSEGPSAARPDAMTSTSRPESGRNGNGSSRPAPRSSRPRDNSSRFDD